MIVIAADTDPDHAEIITHELTHAITYTFLPDQPHWFSEGLAGYYATAQLSAGGRSVEIGKPLDYVLAHLRTYHAQPIGGVFACQEHGCMTNGYYATTWALFSYLVNEHPTELVRYIKLLQTLPRGQHEHAWEQAAPALKADVLDTGLGEWLAHGQLTVARFEVAFSTVPTATRPLRDSDALAVRAMLRFQFAAKEADGEIAAAIAADPTSVLAQWVVTMRDRRVDADTARATATAHPDDWRAWSLEVYGGGPEASEARDQVCKLAGADTVREVVEDICK